ncbi:MAG: S9 family peptidase, partial [Acidobacteria bacterium]|nr:S9 family peptidase [Acidobacteriota bacterium]
RLIFDSGPFAGIKLPVFDKNDKYLAFVAKSSEEGKSDIWILDLNSMAMENICRKIENPKSINFSPDSQKLYFIANAPRKKNDKKLAYDRLTEMYQRWGDWKDRPHLFVLDIKTKSLSQITAGESNLFDYSISKDGKKAALLRGVFTTKRPYLKSEIYLYDFEKYSSKKVLSWDKWPDISEVSLSPDAKTIAVMASKGEMPEGGLKPKEYLAYNLNLFIVDVETGNYECVSENFRPALSSQAITVFPPRKNLYWDEDGIYFFATDKDRVMLYKFNPTTKEFKLIAFDDPVLSSPSISFGSGQVLYNASALGKFWEVKVGDIKTFQTKTLWFPGKEILSRVKLGLLEPFDVVAKDGEIIQGWLLYPPDFDKSKKYPTIVAYYGGVMPYGRAFRGEMFWLAGQGYIVYIVTPRGSVGYGQEFADAHCNDWGKIAGEDIIEGVKTLIKLRPCVDEKKIGCFGGSYGGFMTLYLIGKSNLFSAAVDYFGISNIASYWGAGWWGFNYGDTAIAGSYPWTRKDVFVEQSPLFFADKINAPLLLLHGTSDTNVPSVESDQIFTALRVQNKKVEYVRFFEEDHGINSKPSVRIASEEMMLEWFDKYLKGEKGAWDYRWKDETKPIEEESK